MELMKMTEKEERAFKRKQNFEKLKKTIKLLSLKLLRKSIPKDDKDTLQAHPNKLGEYNEYYINNLYLQESMGYTSVTELVVDPENKRYIYIGLVNGADNAEGILETNIPLPEIVASVNGNIALQKMLSRQRVVSERKRYYNQIGEEDSPIEGHTTFFGKPVFPLGRIEEQNGRFKITSETTAEVERTIQAIKEENEIETAMQEKDFIEFDLGGGLVVAEPDCWLEPGKGVQFGGVNIDALKYKYMARRSIPTDDGKFVYTGKVTIGKSLVKTTDSGERKFITPTQYKNIAFWSDKKSIMQYFIDKKFAGLIEVLGEMFTDSNIEEKERNNGVCFIGGITLDEYGKCKKTNEIPDVVKDIAEKSVNNSSNIVEFGDIEK